MTGRKCRTRSRQRKRYYQGAVEEGAGEKNPFQGPGRVAVRVAAGAGRILNDIGFTETEEHRGTEMKVRERSRILRSAGGAAESLQRCGGDPAEPAGGVPGGMSAGMIGYAIPLERYRTRTTSSRWHTRRRGAKNYHALYLMSVPGQRGGGRWSAFARPD
jgi:hypothetical protein